MDLQISDSNNINVNIISASSLNVESVSSNLSISGSNLTQINGNVDSANISNISSTLNLDISVTGILELNNDTVTNLVFTGVNTINELDINSSSVLMINSNSVDITTLKYEANANDTIITTTSDEIELSTTGNAEIILNYEGTSLLNLQSNVSNSVIVNITTASSLNVESISGNLNINGSNLTQINGAVDSVNISNTSGTLNLDISVTGILELNNDTVTNITFTGVSSINELDINSSSVLMINSNTVDITTLKYEANANDTLITTNTNEIELLATGNAEITLNYEGTSLLNLKANGSNSVIVELSLASSLDVEGEVTNITITGENVDSVDTELLTVYNRLTLNNTLIDDLDFISNDVLINVDILEVNTLTNLNIEIIMTVIDNSLIELISPIVAVDVYNYYFDGQVIILVSLEALDTVRYDGYKSIAINNAWAEIINNQYMDHLNELITKTEIESQVYQTAEAYFISYRDNAGLTEFDFTVQERLDVVNAIQVTLDDPLLTISEVALNSQVTASINADAAIYATNEQTNDSFTIS